MPSENRLSRLSLLLGQDAHERLFVIAKRTAQRMTEVSHTLENGKGKSRKNPSLCASDVYAAHTRPSVFEILTTRRSYNDPEKDAKRTLSRCKFSAQKTEIAKKYKQIKSIITAGLKSTVGLERKKGNQGRVGMA